MSMRGVVKHVLVAMAGVSIILTMSGQAPFWLVLLTCLVAGSLVDLLCTRFWR